VPREWTGRDLSKALVSRKDHELPHAIVEFPDNTSEQFGRYAYRSIRSPSAKLILWEDNAKPDELYDLVKDARERTNLIEDRAYDTIEADLRRHLNAWMKRTADTFRMSPGRS
jgi:hypothetical protein